MAVQLMTTKLLEKKEADVPVGSRAHRGVLDSLSPDDRLILGHFLSDPVEFIDHPDLHRRQAEAKLFGAVAELVSPGVPCFAPAQPVVTRSAGPRGIPTLSGEQERTLFLRYNYARMCIRKLQDQFPGRAMTAKATRQFLAWGRRALEARSTITEMNLPLVMAMAKRTRLASIDYNELISEGNMALLRSVNKFDCNRGFKFSTYACRAILKSFSRVAMRISRYRGRFPTEFDPAIERSDYLEHKRDEIETDCVQELKEILLRNLADLSEVEQTVIHERFALRRTRGDNFTPKTLEQVGTIIGVTKERVRQIQNKALKKIRTALEDKYLAA
ncbi:MAG: sigma-70 family RNA polymerase sigma factor [Phycisphaerae bacterium]|nr:sigma-70 family RNA polymerase sigma factor [Phycisphaerae bacterium]